nr:tRNA (adenosine(37)-N6)-threonylcarbamoyltransferase complex dimerization subunit type 1 TsaB [Desulfobacterales bacterium]
AIINNSDIICEQILASSQTHSKHLMGMIKNVLDLSDLAIKDMDGFAVTIGPGTFTGLRIGISLIKGLAAASGKPVAGISSLKALATQSSFSGQVCTMIDARREEVYSALYSVAALGFYSSIIKQKSVETVMAPEKAVSGINEPTLFIGNGAFLYQQKIEEILGQRAIFPSLLQNTIQASTIARLGVEQLQNEYCTSPHPLIPRYIRASDAEKMKSLIE